MTSKAIVCAIAAASLGFGSLSYAQGYDGRGPDRGQRFEQRDQRQEARRDLREARRDAREARRDLRDTRANGNVWHWNPEVPRLQRGGYVPQHYRAQRYVVNDWRAHHLYAPPAGQQWVRADNGDYALMAIATGLIAALVVNQLQ